MSIKLADIFIPVPDQLTYTNRELSALEIREDFIAMLAKQLDVPYLENGNEGGNVCFANHEQLRPEFRMYFSKSDIIAYVDAVLQANDFDLQKDEVPFPKMDEFFIKD